MNKYRSSSELKGMAREHLTGFYGVTVRAYIWMNLILLCLTWLSASITGLGSASRVFYVLFYLLYFLIAGIFSSGSAYMYLNIVNGQQAYGSMIFYCFRYHTDKSVLVTLFKLCAELICCIVMLFGYAAFEFADRGLALSIFVVGLGLAIVGSAIVEAIYLPAYYLIHDFPDKSTAEIIGLCPRLMSGRVFELILLFIGMIPLRLLELLSFGVAAPWAESYVSAIYAEYYMDIMRPATDR